MIKTLSLPTRILALLLVAMLISFMAAPGFAERAFAAEPEPYAYQVKSADGAIKAHFKTDSPTTNAVLTYTALTDEQIDALQKSLTDYDTLFPLANVKITDIDSGADIALNDLELNFDLNKLLRGTTPTYTLPSTSDANNDEDGDDYDEGDDDESDDDDYADDEWAQGVYTNNEIVPINPLELTPWWTEPALKRFVSKSTNEPDPLDGDEPYYDANRNVYIIDGDTYVRDERTGGYVFFDKNGEPDYYFPDNEDYDFILGDHSDFTGADGQVYSYDKAANAYISASGARFAYNAEDGVYYSEDYEYFYSYDDKYEYDEEDADEDEDEDGDADEASVEADADNGDVDDEDTDGESIDDEDAEGDEADSDNADGVDDDDKLIYHGIRELDGYPGWYWNYDDILKRWHVDTKIIENTSNAAQRLEYSSSKYYESAHSQSKATNFQELFVFDGKYYKYDKNTGLYKRFQAYEKQYGAPILNDGKYHFYYDTNQKTYYEIEEDDADGYSDYYYNKNYRNYSFLDFWYKYNKKLDTYSFNEPLNTFDYYAFGRYYYENNDGDGLYYINDKGMLAKVSYRDAGIEDLDDGEAYYTGLNSFAYAAPKLTADRVPIVVDDSNYGDYYEYDEDEDDETDYGEDRAPENQPKVTLHNFTSVDGKTWAKVWGYTELPTSKELKAAQKRAGDDTWNDKTYQLSCLGYLPLDDVVPAKAYSKKSLLKVLSYDHAQDEAEIIEVDSNNSGVVTIKANALLPFALKYSFDPNNIRMPVLDAAPAKAAVARPAESGMGQGNSKSGFDSNAVSSTEIITNQDPAANDANSLYGRGVLGKMNKDAPSVLDILRQGNMPWIIIAAAVVAMAIAVAIIAIRQKKQTLRSIHNS